MLWDRVPSGVAIEERCTVAHLAERGAGDEEALRGLAHVAVAALPAATASVRLHRPRTHRHLRCGQPQAQTQALQPRRSAPPLYFRRLRASQGLACMESAEDFIAGDDMRTVYQTMGMKSCSRRLGVLCSSTGKSFNDIEGLALGRCRLMSSWIGGCWQIGRLAPCHYSAAEHSRRIGRGHSQVFDVMLCKPYSPPLARNTPET